MHAACSTIIFPSCIVLHSSPPRHQRNGGDSSDGTARDKQQDPKQHKQIVKKRWRGTRNRHRRIPPLPTTSPATVNNRAVQNAPPTLRLPSMPCGRDLASHGHPKQEQTPLCSSLWHPAPELCYDQKSGRRSAGHGDQGHASPWLAGGGRFSGVYGRG